MLSRRGQVLPTEWTLNLQVCQKLWRLWGRPSIDLFASSQNKRIPNYCSLVPDREAIAVDAFLMDWTGMDTYAFPPFKIINLVVKKFALLDSGRMTLVAPFWPAREWFTEVVEMLVDFPRSLPPSPRLLRQPHFERYHQNPLALQLTAFRLSRSLSEREDFQLKLQELSPERGGSLHREFTNQSGKPLDLGVSSIRFPQPLPL